MTDEDTIERAFLSALRTHFKKPGPWLPRQAVEANGSWPDSKGIPDGQVWEVYVLQIVTLSVWYDLKGGILISPASANVWYPTDENNMYYFDSTGGGAIDTTAKTWDASGGLTYSYASVSMRAKGLILGEAEGVTCTSAFFVRVRRRFDLET